MRARTSWFPRPRAKWVAGISLRASSGFRIGSFAGGTQFRFQTRVPDLTVDGAQSIDTDNYIFTPRTAGLHTFSASNQAGNVQWFLDGALVATTGPGVWGAGLQTIETVLLFAHGNTPARSSDLHVDRFQADRCSRTVDDGAGCGRFDCGGGRKAVQGSSLNTANEFGLSEVRRM